MAARNRERTSPHDVSRPPQESRAARREFVAPPTPAAIRATRPAVETPLAAELVPRAARGMFEDLRDWAFALDADSPYGVPRRFGLGTIFIVTAVFALAFAILDAALTSYEFPAEGIPGIVSVVAVIGAGQAFLFQGRRPRLASIVSGMVLVPVLAVMLTLLAERYASGPAGNFLGRGLVVLAGLAGALVAARYFGVRPLLLVTSAPSLVLAGVTLMSPWNILPPVAAAAGCMACAAALGLACAVRIPKAEGPWMHWACLALTVYVSAVVFTGARDAVLFGVLLPFYFLPSLALLAPLGAFVGYASGGIVAGVFLIMDAVETQLEARRAERNAPLATRSSPWDDGAP
jgi:hypothetical protein